MEKIYRVPNTAIKVSVSLEYSEHSKCYFVSGGIHGRLITGSDSFYSNLVRKGIRQFAKSQNIQIGQIEKMIYGIYSAKVI